MAGAQLPREGDTHCLLGRAFHVRPRSRHLSRTTIRILTPATDSPAATRRRNAPLPMSSAGVGRESHSAALAVWQDGLDGPADAARYRFAVPSCLLPDSAGKHELARPPTRVCGSRTAPHD